MSVERLYNIRIAFNDKSLYLVTLGGTLLMAGLLFYFTDIPLILGNYGYLMGGLQIGAQILLALLFGINLALLWYKIKLAGQVNQKVTGTTMAGSILGVLVTGCPACGLTVASYIGLSGVLSALPLFGLELKIVGLALMASSIFMLSKNLHTCDLSISN